MAKRKKGLSARNQKKGGFFVYPGSHVQPKLSRDSATYLSSSLAEFTLVDEAQQTSSHSLFSSNEHTKLRNNPVQFTSAGQTEPLKGDCITREIATNGDLSPTSLTGRQIQSEMRCQASGPLLNKCTKSINSHDTCGFRSFASYESSDHFDRVDDRKSRAFHRDAPSGLPRRQASVCSASSEEIILFRGRNSRRSCPSAAGSSAEGNTSYARFEAKPKNSRIQVDSSVCQPTNQNSLISSARQMLNTRRIRRAHDEDYLDDYISNMQETGELDYLLGRVDQKHRNLIVSDEDSCLVSSRPNHRNDYIDHAADAGNERPRSRSRYDEDMTVHPILAPSTSSSSSTGILQQQSTESSGSGGHLYKFPLFRGQVDFESPNWEQPIICRPKRGKGTQQQKRVLYRNCDSDLETQLQTSWENDRLKKKERKKQREELRALGILGKNATLNDLSVKYSSGMNMEEIGEELRTFFQNGDELISFPPMDLHARKIIHELANRFNLKSKSIGKADQRRPVLYRTIRTLPYAEGAFNQALGRIQRRFIPRLDTKGKRNKKSQVSGGSNKTVANYQEGEIVGAAAPELGTENRGRAMLERMGWSSGTALGTVNNKGILQPVTHTMKRSKAGLQ